MTPLWLSSDAADATKGQAQGDWSVTGISIDTRSIEAGDLFVALKDQRDGHEFVAQALAKGAGAAMVSHIPDDVPEGAPLLIVPDVLAGLEALGHAGRARFKGKVIGVTGSVGKTSTKEMLRTVLTRQGIVHAAEKSFNNHWGVPITLARMPFDADYAVIEIGMNHPGEIAPLARMAQLDVAMITNVAAVHMEAFDNIAGIAREKAAIGEGLVADGVLVVNSDSATNANKALEAAMPSGAIWFGEHAESLWRLRDVTTTADTTVAKADSPLGPVLFKLASPGQHLP